MLQSNQVTLIGQVLPERMVRCLIRGGQMLSFMLRTVEVWHTRAGGSDQEHYEYHKIVVRDSGGYQMLSKVQKLIAPGNRLLVSGKLRYRLIKDARGQVSGAETEIEADAIELLAEPGRRRRNSKDMPGDLPANAPFSVQEDSKSA